MLAKPGCINISEETKLLVGQRFKFKDPQEAQVKGFLRTIKYFEMEQNKNLKSHLTNLEGDGFKLTVDEDKLTQNALEDLKETLSSIECRNFSN